MNLGTLRNNVVRRLGEATETFYPVWELNAWINLAQLEFQLEQLKLFLGGRPAPGLLEKSATFATTGGDWRIYPYSLVTDFIWPTRVVFSGVPLTRVRSQELDRYDRSWMATAGNPLHWGMIGLNLMFIYPRPATVVNLNVTYAYEPALLGLDTDSPVISLEFHAALESYATYLALAKESVKTINAQGQLNDFIRRSRGVATEPVISFKV